MRVPVLLALFANVLVATIPTTSNAEDRFDIAITGGRVIDPGSGFDAIRNVGIRYGLIVAINSQPMSAEQIIVADGRVVAPGFIDLHTHSPTPLGQRYQLLDG